MSLFSAQHDVALVDYEWAVGLQTAIDLVGNNTGEMVVVLRAAKAALINSSAGCLRATS